MPAIRNRHSASQPHRRYVIAESSAQAARRRREPTESEEEEEEEEEEEMEEVVGEVENLFNNSSRDERRGEEVNKNWLVKMLIRFVIACEYNRQPIRRSDISSKVLSPHGRLFKEIFGLAQSELQRVFGMTLQETPTREKLKLAHRRAQANSEKPRAVSKTYILVSTVPAAYKPSENLSPQANKEQTYAGLVWMIVSLLYLNGGSVAEVKLSRYLERLNVAECTPIDKTEKVLHNMVRQGYLLKIKDDTGEVTDYEYYVGPRAKVEIGPAGLEGLVRTVYGAAAPDDLKARIQRNIGIELS